MKIQKIFSDEYSEERLYSVLMTEEEVALFSEIQKEFGVGSKKVISKIRKKLGISLTDRELAAKKLKNLRNQNNELLEKRLKQHRMGNGNNLERRDAISTYKRNLSHNDSIEAVRDEFGLEKKSWFK